MQIRLDKKIDQNRHDARVRMWRLGAVGNDRLRAEGAAQEAKGKVQKTVGDAKSAAKSMTNKAAAAIDKKL